MNFWEKLKADKQHRGLTGYANEGHNIHHLARVYLQDSIVIRIIDFPYWIRRLSFKNWLRFTMWRLKRKFNMIFDIKDKYGNY